MKSDKSCLNSNTSINNDGYNNDNIIITISWCIENQTGTYIQSRRCVTRWKREASPSRVENRKNCPDFEKNNPDCVHFLVKFFIQNVVLRVSRRKNSKMFPCRTSLSCILDEMFIEVP